MATTLRAVLLLGWTLGIAVGSGQVPSESSQRQWLNLMRDYADRYMANLPDFICEQVVRQYEAGRKPKHWREGDTLISKLLFSEGHEERSLELVNGKPVRRGTRPWRTPLTTEGEFGVLLSNVLGPASDATFVWDRWDKIGEKRVVVFDYSIDQEHSTLKLSRSDLARAVVPYHGSIYADPETGAVWRITDAISEIPEEIRTRSVLTSIDYDEIGIADKKYLLPIRASVLMKTDSNTIRNEMEFAGYRKFETDSTVTFTSENSQR